LEEYRLAIRRMLGMADDKPLPLELENALAEYKLMLDRLNQPVSFGDLAMLALFTSKEKVRVLQRAGMAKGLLVGRNGPMGADIPEENIVNILDRNAEQI